MPLTLETLRTQYRDDILRLAEEYGVSDVRVFGSVVRGEATDDSDVDLLVHLNRPLGLRFVTLRNALADALQHEVDLVSDNGLSPYIGPHILKEAVAL